MKISDLQVVEPDVSKEKQIELYNKILPLTNGMTIKQVEKSLEWIMNALKDEYIICLED